MSLLFAQPERFLNFPGKGMLWESWLESDLPLIHCPGKYIFGRQRTTLFFPTKTQHWSMMLKWGCGFCWSWLYHSQTFLGRGNHSVFPVSQWIQSSLAKPVPNTKNYRKRNYRKCLVKCGCFFFFFFIAGLNPDPLAYQQHSHWSLMMVNSYCTTQLSVSVYRVIHKGGYTPTLRTKLVVWGVMTHATSHNSIIISVTFITLTMNPVPMMYCGVSWWNLKTTLKRSLFIER